MRCNNTHSCAHCSEHRENGVIIGSTVLKFGLFSFSPTVVNAHGFVGSQELLVENDRAASQPQRLRKLSNAKTTQIISYFIQNL
jgi:hypothetical protein